MSAAVVSPPLGNTGAEITAGIHWLSGTVLGLEPVEGEERVSPAEQVVDWLATLLDESVVALDHGSKGYTEAFLVGPVKVLGNERRPDMGVFVEVSGAGCEELGLQRLIEIGDVLRVSRLDLALDDCPFTPAQIRDEWRADNVRTRCKVPEDALPGREWRTCSWHESATGDTFSMGSRQSTQYARCYNSRGFTRFELELKRGAAVAAFEMVKQEPENLGEVALRWVRRFVDFVDKCQGENVSRAVLLPFWADFIAGASKARVVLEGMVRRTVADVRHWVEKQVAPAMGILWHVFGTEELLRLVFAGRKRWGTRHRAILRTADTGQSLPLAC